MTEERAKKMLKAKLECLKRETSGTDIDCNYRNCDECNLCYEQGNMGEQKEALEIAIKALEQTRWIPISERLPEDKSYVLVTIKVHQRQPHVRSSWYQEGFFHNDNGDSWRATDKEVVGWMYSPQPYKAESEEAE